MSQSKSTNFPVALHLVSRWAISALSLSAKITNFNGRVEKRIADLSTTVSSLIRTWPVPQQTSPITIVSVSSVRWLVSWFRFDDDLNGFSLDSSLAKASCGLWTWSRKLYEAKRKSGKQNNNVRSVELKFRFKSFILLDNTERKECSKWPYRHLTTTTYVYLQLKCTVADSHAMHFEVSLAFEYVRTKEREREREREKDWRRFTLSVMLREWFLDMPYVHPHTGR